MINKNLFLSAGLLYQSSIYSQTETILTFQDVFISERLKYLKFPIQVGVVKSLNSFDLFIQGGISTHYLLSAKADLELFGRDPEFPNPLNGLARKTSDYNLRNQRRKTTINYSVGTGIRKNTGLYGIEFSIQYEPGLNNLVEQSERFSDPVLLNTFSYVPDDFKMNNFQLRIGLVRHFVTPKKRQ